MRIHSIEVKHFKGIPSARLDLGTGLNVLYGVNDLGKSSLAEALRAGLLMLPGATEAAAYTPWGSVERPVVKVDFEVGGIRWRLEKTFGTANGARLETSPDGRRWTEKAKGRSADGDVRKLLSWGIPAPGGQGGYHGMPEPFLATALLGRQGKVDTILAADVLSDKANSGEGIIRAALGVLAQDPGVTKMLERLEGKVAEAFTPTGLWKNSGDSRRLRSKQELEELEARLRDTQARTTQWRGVEVALLAALADREQAVTGRDEAMSALKDLRARGEQAAARRAAQDKADAAGADLERVTLALAKAADSKASLMAREAELTVVAAAHQVELDALGVCEARVAEAETALDELLAQQAAIKDVALANANEERQRGIDLEKATARLANARRVEALEKRATVLAGDIALAESRVTAAEAGLAAARAQVGHAERWAAQERLATARAEAVELEAAAMEAVAQANHAQAVLTAASALEVETRAVLEAVRIAETAVLKDTVHAREVAQNEAMTRRDEAGRRAVVAREVETRELKCAEVGREASMAGVAHEAAQVVLLEARAAVELASWGEARAAVRIADAEYEAALVAFEAAEEAARAAEIASRDAVALAQEAKTAQAQGAAATSVEELEHVATRAQAALGVAQGEHATRVASRTRAEKLLGLSEQDAVARAGRAATERAASERQKVATLEATEKREGDASEAGRRAVATATAALRASDDAQKMVGDVRAQRLEVQTELTAAKLDMSEASKAVGDAHVALAKHELLATKTAELTASRKACAEADVALARSDEVVREAGAEVEELHGVRAWFARAAIVDQIALLQQAGGAVEAAQQVAAELVPQAEVPNDRTALVGAVAVAVGAVVAAIGIVVGSAAVGVGVGLALAVLLVVLGLASQRRKRGAVELRLATAGADLERTIENRQRAAAAHSEAQARARASAYEQAQSLASQAAAREAELARYDSDRVAARAPALSASIGQVLRAAEAALADHRSARERIASECHRARIQLDAAQRARDAAADDEQVRANSPTALREQLRAAQVELKAAASRCETLQQRIAALAPGGPVDSSDPESLRQAIVRAEADLAVHERAHASAGGQLPEARNVAMQAAATAEGCDLGACLARIAELRGELGVASAPDFGAARHAVDAAVLAETAAERRVTEAHVRSESAHAAALAGAQELGQSVAEVRARVVAIAQRVAAATVGLGIADADALLRSVRAAETEATTRLGEARAQKAVALGLRDDKQRALDGMAVVASASEPIPLQVAREAHEHASTVELAAGLNVVRLRSQWAAANDEFNTAEAKLGGPWREILAAAERARATAEGSLVALAQPLAAATESREHEAQEASSQASRAVVAARTGVEQATLAADRASQERDRGRTHLAACELPAQGAELEPVDLARSLAEVDVATCALEVARTEVAAARATQVEAAESLAVGEHEIGGSWAVVLANAEADCLRLAAASDGSARRAEEDGLAQAVVAATAVVAARGVEARAMTVQERNAAAVVDVARAARDAASGHFGGLETAARAFDASAIEALWRAAEVAKEALPPGEVVATEVLTSAEREHKERELALKRAQSAVDDRRGQLKALEGATLEDRLKAEGEACVRLRERLTELELEYLGAKLLLETLTKAAAEHTAHLGTSLAKPVSERFHALTGGRYDRVTIEPSLKTQGLQAAGGTRSTNDLSVGTREQLATIIRLCLAAQLRSVLLLDDQLVHSDFIRLGWFRDQLRSSVRDSDHQILVFTARPDDYVSKDELPVGAMRHLDSENGKLRVVNLGHVLAL